MNKIISQNILCFFKNCSHLTLFESQREVEQLFNDLESLEKSKTDHYTELLAMENILFNKCEILLLSLKGKLRFLLYFVKQNPFYL